MYQEINQSLLRSRIFQPCGFAQPLTDGGEDEKRAASLYRDAAVNNMRFFNIFYGFKPSVFALSVNMLDRLLAKVKVSHLIFVLAFVIMQNLIRSTLYV